MSRAVLLLAFGWLLAGCSPNYQPLDDEAYCTGTAAARGPHCADWRERHWQSSR
jgi:hypothetical protein